MMRTSTPDRQSGATMIVAIIMLVLLTLFVLSAISSGLINLRISSNTQARDEARAAAQQGVERVVSSLTNFDPTPTGLAATNFSVNNDPSGNYSVTVSTPVCKRAELQIPPKTTDCANGVVSGVACVDTLWEITATATDTRSGVSQTVVQGVAITFAPGLSPASTSGCQAP